MVVSCSWVVRRPSGHCQDEHSPPKGASRTPSHFPVFHWLIDEQLCPACLPEVFFFLLIQRLMSEIKCYHFSAQLRVSISQHRTIFLSKMCWDTKICKEQYMLSRVSFLWQELQKLLIKFPFSPKKALVCNKNRD